MTREEAKEKDLHSLTRHRFKEADKHIAKLRAELKDAEWRVELALAQLKERDSRTCDSCKLYDSTGKCMLSKQDSDVWTFINVEPNFGCNKWE